MFLAAGAGATALTVLFKGFLAFAMACLGIYDLAGVDLAEVFVVSE